jgi:hypothetical protein
MMAASVLEVVNRETHTLESSTSYLVSAYRRYPQYKYLWLEWNARDVQMQLMGDQD